VEVFVLAIGEVLESLEEEWAVGKGGDLGWKEGGRERVEKGPDIPCLGCHFAPNFLYINLIVSNYYLSYNFILRHKSKHQAMYNSPDSCKRFSSDTCNGSS
jgi:hypothetical protein